MHPSLRALAALVFVVASLSGCNCSPSQCSATNCPGCCDSSGTCQGGFLPERCGTAGAACAACSVGQSCTAGHCGILSTGGGGGGNGSTGGGIGTGGGFGTGGGGGGNTSAFCGNYAAAYCDYGIRCGEFSQQGRGDCIAFIGAALCAPTFDSVSKGFQTLSNTAQSCIDSFSTLSCSADNPLDTGPCSEPLTVAASSTGQGCLTSGDCVVATDSCGGNSACSRTCVSTNGTLGQPCPRSALCANNLRCDVATNTCANPHGLGETCEPFGSGECGVDARCDETTTTCVALPTSGPCYNEYQCASTSYCDTSTTNVCMPRKTDGQTCSFDQCVAGFWCDFSNSTCKAQTAQGTACQLYYGSCQSGLTCLNGSCQPPLGQGSTCHNYSDCADGLSCDPVINQCSGYSNVASGQSCTNYSLYCRYPDVCRGSLQNPDGGVGVEGTCGPPMLGDSCNSIGAGECAAENYCALDGGSGVCSASTHNSPCGAMQDCLPGDFCNGSNCQALQQQGGACEAGISGQCVAPLQCVSTSADGGSGACGTLGGANASCVGDSSCQFPLACINGTCVSAGHQGEPCFEGSVCLLGLCQADAGIYGTCTGQTAANGDPCEFGPQCSSGRCQNFSVCVASCP